MALCWLSVDGPKLNSLNGMLRHWTQCVTDLAAASTMGLEAVAASAGREALPFHSNVSSAFLFKCYEKKVFALWSWILTYQKER
jgi:hypothetical protein